MGLAGLSCRPQRARGTPIELARGGRPDEAGDSLALRQARRSHRYVRRRQCRAFGCDSLLGEQPPSSREIVIAHVRVGRS